MAAGQRLTEEAVAALNEQSATLGNAVDAASIVAREGIHAYHRNLIRQHMSQHWQRCVPTTEAQWDDFVKEVASAAAKAKSTGFQLPVVFATSTETPMMRFLAISIAEDPQPWLARAALKEDRED